MARVAHGALPRPMTAAEERADAARRADGNRVLCDREGCLDDDGAGFEVFAHRPACSLRAARRGVLVLVCPVPWTPEP
jgi:hypothetical protein